MRKRIEADELRLQPERYFKEGQHIVVQSHCVGNFPLHWHNYFEMEILYEGEAVHYLNGKEYKMGVGCGYILTPADYHMIVPNDPNQKIWHIPFDETFLSAKHLNTLLSSNFDKTFSLDEETYTRVEKLLYLLKYECKLEGESCTRELFDCLLSMIFRTMTDIPPIIPTENISDIAKGILYLETHFREDPSLSDVAAYAGFNPSYFSVLFHKVTGKTYTQYLNILRVNYAKKLLGSEMSVADICYASGFGTLSNFHNIFAKLTGTSPSEYRRSRRKD